MMNAIFSCRIVSNPCLIFHRIVSESIFHCFYRLPTDKMFTGLVNFDYPQFLGHIQAKL